MACGKRVWRRLLGVEGAVVEDMEWEDESGALVVAVRPAAKERGRCPRCRRRCPGYDAGGGPRRWRGLDLGAVQVFLEAELPRVRCREHGVVTAAVPWARHDSRFTRDFEDQVAWLAVRSNRTTVAELMRIAWLTVGRIIERVGDEARQRVDLLGGLRRIGIDEWAYRRKHKYITLVVDHDSGRLVWAGPGRDKATVARFFADMGEERSKSLEFVSADGAPWIDQVVRTHAPQAILCLDPFHVAQWASRALDQVRRDVWNQVRRGGDLTLARRLKHSRWVLWKRREALAPRQQERLAEIASTNRPLYRAYLLKEALRATMKEGDIDKSTSLLDGWLAWASRSKLEPFVKLARTIRAYRPRLQATLAYGLSNARLEAAATQLDLLLRLAHGFHRVEALLGLAFLKLGGLCPPLPGRQAPTTMS